jgi:hypothetical protein
MHHTAPGESAPRAPSRTEPPAPPARPTGMVKRFAPLLVITIGLAGCAQGTSSGTLPAEAPVSSSPSAPVPGWARSIAPPKEPTDRIKKTDIVAGLVTKGGSGPCYGVTTDDGTQYALHSTAGLQLPKGKYVRVRTAPSALRIYCGPGRLLDLVRVESID